MMVLNKNTVETWLAKFDKGELNATEESQLMSFLENDEVMNDTSLDLQVVHNDVPNKVEFTHLANKAKTDIELLAFDIAEGNLLPEESIWLDQLYASFPSLQKLVIEFNQLPLQSNNAVVFANKEQLKRTSKIIVLNRYWMSVAASVLVVIALTFMYQSKPQYYNPRVASITITPFEYEALKIVPIKKVDHHLKLNIEITKPEEIQVPQTMDLLAKKEETTLPIIFVDEPLLAMATNSYIAFTEQEQTTAVEQKVASIKDGVQSVYTAGVENTTAVFDKAKSFANEINEELIKTPKKWRLKETKRFKILGTNFVFEPIASVE